MKKFSQLFESKLNIGNNTVNYLSAGELQKYLDKEQDDFYDKVIVDISKTSERSYSKTFDPKDATITIINYLIKHNDTYVKELGGSGNPDNALAAFYQRSMPTDPEKKAVYRAITVLKDSGRLKEVPVFQTREEFDDIMNDRCSLDYVVYDMKSERGRNQMAKQYKGLIYMMAHKYKNNANVDFDDWVGAAHLGFTDALNEYSKEKGLVQNVKTNKDEQGDFQSADIEGDSELKKEVNDEKKKKRKAVKFIVFAKWKIHFWMLGYQENSHLVRIPKSAQSRERKLKGSNTWNNTTSVDAQIGNGQGDGKSKTVGDTLGSSMSASDSLTKSDHDKIFNAFYKYLGKHFDKQTVAIFLTHYGLKDLVKIGNKDWSAYLTNCEDKDLDKLYDAIVDGDEDAEKKWIEDYKNGKFAKRTSKAKGAGASSISMKVNKVIDFIRHDKGAFKAIQELQAFENAVQNDKDHEHTLLEAYDTKNLF